MDVHSHFDGLPPPHPCPPGMSEWPVRECWLSGLWAVKRNSYTWKWTHGKKEILSSEIEDRKTLNEKFVPKKCNSQKLNKRGQKLDGGVRGNNHYCWRLKRQITQHKLQGGYGLNFLKDFISLFLERVEWREVEKQWCVRETLMGCLSTTTQACAPTWNRIGDLFWFAG